MSVILDTPEAVVVHGPWQETLAVAQERGGVDALIVDAPYSERTHAGHDGGAEIANGKGPRDNRVRYEMGLRAERRQLNYAPWGPSLVTSFVGGFHKLTRGWFVTVTDDALAPEWRCAMDAFGRYAFAPLPFVETGSRVRLAGDGPSNWTCWIVVGRPRSGPCVRWGTLPGAYTTPAGHGDGKRRAWVGGKPLWLMLALVRDYSRRGDLVCDPCAGGFTTGRAARMLGRRFIGGDIDRAAAEEGVRVLLAAKEQIAMPWGERDAAGK